MNYADAPRPPPDSRFRLRGVGDYGIIGAFIGDTIPLRWIVARDVTGMTQKSFELLAFGF